MDGGLCDVLLANHECFQITLGLGTMPVPWVMRFYYPSFRFLTRLPTLQSTAKSTEVQSRQRARSSTDRFGAQNYLSVRFIIACSALAFAALET